MMEGVYLTNYNGSKNLKVGIVSFPWQSYAPYKFLSEIIKILDSFVDRIVLINGNSTRVNIKSKKVEIKDIGIAMHYVKEKKPAIYSVFLWFIKCLLAQIKICWYLVNIKKDVDIIIFYVAYPYYLLPLIFSKILGKKTIEIITRSKSNDLYSKMLSLQDPILFRLLNGISPESRILILELNLDKFEDKVLQDGARYIDFSRFTQIKSLSERKSLVGFVGRLRKEKGVMDFVNAIPYVVKENKDIEFLIGGHGDLYDWVKYNCKRLEKDFKSRITVTGFIDDNDFSTYLNELKLFVLPTRHAEGLPTIILEAMSCGTPVLATQLGAITDLIKDGETGFLMENCSIECISKNIIRALNHPNLENIVKNARMLIETKYSYEAAVERYKMILNKVLND